MSKIGKFHDRQQLAEGVSWCKRIPGSRALLFQLLVLVMLPIVRPYDITDPRFCWITPQPFACQRCLRDGQQFVQILEFESDGRPIRSYACRAWERPYLR